MSNLRAWFDSSLRPKRWARRVGTVLMTGFLVAGTFASLDAEARRMGGSRSIGRQSPTLQQTAPSATRSQTAPMQAQRTPQPGATPAAAAPNRSRWLGPIAGLAAGLGIAALLSHFGLGGAFASMMANLIVIALLAMAGIWIVRKLMNRRRAQEPAYAGAGVGTASRSGSDGRGLGGYGQGGGYAGLGSAYAGEAQRVFAGGAAAAAATATTGPALPAGFDADAFVRSAKVHFVRLQAAWDDGNLADIREFTTPEMFAEVKIDLDARGAEKNHTDVVRLDAQLLEVDERRDETFASVRFSGLIRESAGAAAEPFEEIWNLSKANGEGWLLAGIQQVAAH